MKRVTLSRYCLCVAVLALMACGSLQVPASSIASSQTQGLRTSKDLLYVSLAAEGGVGMYSYAGEHVGRLNGPPPGFNGNERGMCSDSAGDVFVSDPQVPAVVAYRHADPHRIKVYSFKAYPLGCSVSSADGNLAAFTHDPDGIAIFKRGSSEAAVYTLPAASYPTGCSYDGSGNLFVTARHLSKGVNRFAYYELPDGESSFKQLHLSAVKVAAEITWDGQHIVIADLTHTLYTIDGTKVIKTTRFEGGALSGFSIHDGRLIAANSYPQYVNIWNYPQGGRVIERFPVVYEPYAVTISAATKS
jgi:hypothetical protein